MKIFLQTLAVYREGYTFASAGLQPYQPLGGST